MCVGEGDVCGCALCVRAVMVFFFFSSIVRNIRNVIFFLKVRKVL